ncbi:WS/DGAT domain-containing protein [Amycolatopsis alkalitolerans]|uniref:diacylglycerol O-acyltransferase n=1 Tax=Amycolatopsis alkalitolerans TaxID=2547244 RepID=A0A5C4LZV4_9PSEU|nr:WS/DGAT domain-containing protein [Amycolatopsis alkalitolerans]TNC24818.1 DUF1298 domain-containing protein [Amycolatopsis alkalitolerans]
MRAQDSLWLSLDRPANRLHITSVLWTEGPVDPVQLREIVADRILARFPVYLERWVPHRLPGRHPMWETDPDFELGRHLVVRDMPAPGDARALQDYVAAERSKPLDPLHPLWSIHLLRGYGTGDAVVFRSHHAMADGIRLTQVMFSLLDPLGATAAPPARVGGRAPHRPPAPHPVGELTATALRAVGRTSAWLQDAARRAGPIAEAAVALPAFGASAAVGATGAAVDLATSRLPAPVRDVVDRLAIAGLTVWHSGEGILKLVGRAETAAWQGRPGEEKTAAWGEPVPLETVRRIARATDATVNDVCTTLVAGAVDRYLAEHGTAGRQREMTWMIPVSLERFDTRLPETLGNHFALVLARLPLLRNGFSERLTEVHRSITHIRDSYEPLVNLGLQTLVSQSPPPVAAALIRYFTDKAVGVLTNVPGPREPMALAGAKVAGVVGWAPCSGRQAITVCIFSYADGIFFGFGTDRQLIPDPEHLVAALEAEVAAAPAA